MLSEEDMLVRAVAANPEDAGLRHAFADWLEERGAVGGVTRLRITATRAPVVDYTFVYGATQLTVSAVTSLTTLWRDLPLPDLLNDREEVYVSETRLKARERCQSAIGTWQQLRTLVEASPSTADWGSRFLTLYEHWLWERNLLHESHRVRRVSTIPLLDRYEDLLALAELGLEQLESYREKEKRAIGDPIQSLIRQPDILAQAEREADEEEQGERKRHSERYRQREQSRKARGRRDGGGVR